MEFDELPTGVKPGLLMNFNVTKLKSGIKRFILLRALRVLRGETVLYFCESLGASPFLFSYPLETTKSRNIPNQGESSSVLPVFSRAESISFCARCSTLSGSGAFARLPMIDLSPWVISK